MAATFPVSSDSRERENSGFSSFSYKDTNFIQGAPCSWSHLDLITSQRPQMESLMLSSTTPNWDWITVLLLQKWNVKSASQELPNQHCLGKLPDDLCHSLKEINLAITNPIFWPSVTSLFLFLSGYKNLPFWSVPGNSFHQSNWMLQNMNWFLFKYTL